MTIVIPKYSSDCSVLSRVYRLSINIIGQTGKMTTGYSAFFIIKLLYTNKKINKKELSLSFFILFNLILFIYLKKFETLGPDWPEA
jgi:hypothetical protein